MNTDAKIKVALADDHVLLRNGLAGLVNSFDNYTVIFEADNGKEFLQKINAGNLPQLVLMDINMPEMDGYETTLWLKRNHPDIKVLALSMYDNENAIIRMLRNGARGYLLKDTEPKEFKQALDAIMLKGFYYSELVTGKLIHAVNSITDDGNELASSIKLSDREIEFLKYICTEMTYREIAEKMFLSPRTIDGYRDALFEKLNIKTRTGLVIFAIKNNLVQL
jgi:two-component system, NarL family, invasion response regulator UvrY